MNDAGLIFVAIAVVWLGLAWQINRRFQVLEDRLDDRVSAIHEQFAGLRDYLYENDPQFDDERSLEDHSVDGGDAWAGKDLHDLRLEKESRGQRTLSSRFRQ